MTEEKLKPNLCLCRDCRKEVSSKAKTCPHCGASRPGLTKKHIWMGWGCVFLLVTYVYFSGSSGDEVSDKSTSSEEFTEASLCEEVKSDPENAKNGIICDENGEVRFIPREITEEDKKAMEESEKESLKCKKDLVCWAEDNMYFAIMECKRVIEQVISTDFKWTESYQILTRYIWNDKENGIIDYIGDNIKFQNSFGVWQNHIYVCTYDPDKLEVVNVQLQPGRL